MKKKINKLKAKGNEKLNELYIVLDKKSSEVEMRKENIKKLELNLNNLENESNLHIEEYQKKKFKILNHNL